MGDKPQQYACNVCGSNWIGASARCPNGCEPLAKSHGEMTKKTFQGDDQSDLKKGLR